jgi:hypothetical protein
MSPDSHRPRPSPNSSSNFGRCKPRSTSSRRSFWTASTGFEPLVWKAVCDEAKVESIEQAFGGYGKGYVRALGLWRTLLKKLSILNHKMHVLMIGHAQIKSFQDPDLASAYEGV